MKSENTYRITKVGNLKDVQKLYRAAFGRYVSMKVVRKRFENVIGYMAYYNGEPVAYYGVFPQDVGGYRAAQSGWTMTHPNHRGKGLFTRLAKVTYDDCFHQGYDFVFGFPNQNSYPGFVKLGWEFHGNMMRFKIKGGLPLSELTYKSKFTRWIYSSKEREIAGIKFRIKNHLMANSSNYEDIEILKRIARKYGCGKIIILLSSNHENLKSFNMTPEKSAPIGFYKFKDIDCSKFQFKIGDCDTYI